jgi:hypothetical protein
MCDGAYLQETRLRLRIGTQLALLYRGVSNAEIAKLTNGDVSEATVSRDRARIEAGEAPSVKSAAAYARLIGRSQGYDLETDEDIDAFVDRVLKARRDFYARVATIQYGTGASHPWPRILDRIIRRIQEENWSSVVDLVETALDQIDADGATAAELRPIKPYLDYYLGFALRREGAVGDALAAFERAYEATRKSNVETALARDAAIEIAFCLIDAARSDAERRIVSLVRFACERSDPTVATVVNVAVLGVRLGGDWVGYFFNEARALALEGAQRVTDPIDLEETARRLVEDEELSVLRSGDMFKDAIAEFEALARKGQAVAPRDER